MKACACRPSDIRGQIDLPGDRARWLLRHFLRLDRDVSAMDRSGEQPVIRVRGLTVGFDDRPVLEGLSLDVARGEILGLVGASGGGKSVLLRTIIGLIPRQGGAIEGMGSAIGGTHD